MLLLSIDATVQRSLLIVTLVTSVLVLVGMLYRVVSRVDRAVTRVEDQVKPNGSAHIAGTQDLTTRDLMDQAQQEMIGFRHDLNKVRRRNDERHKETRSDMHAMRVALDAQTESTERMSTDIFARLAALEKRRHDNRPPQLTMEEEED